MAHKIKLRNSNEKAIVDAQGYEYLTTDKYLSGLDIINRFRKHSSGCAVFQRTKKTRKGGYKTETVYLHKLLAEQFLKKDKSRKNNLVGTKNGNKLDCRLDNLVYRSRSTASRQRKSSSKAGYTGVYKESTRYRAVISHNGKSIHIGMFDTAEEAADAYNKKSKEFYGDEGKINKIPRAALAAAKKAAKEKAKAKADAKKAAEAEKKAAAKAKAAKKKAASKKK
ncbi:MAG: Pathogenesis-related transcriptional factor and ERF protein [Bacteroidota bacterium]